MKKSTLILVALFLVVLLFSFNQNKTIDDNKTGIQFLEGNLQQAKLKAMAENKPIFVDVYATWCGPCKKLKKSTFKDKEVSDYFNKNFVNIAVDGETKEGIEIVNKYNVEGYPTLLILDKDGKLLTQSVGYVKPHILVNFGKRIVP